MGAKTAYIAPGSPWENSYVENFNGRLRDELLDGEILYSLREEQIVIERWRRHYNTVRPHGTLGYQPPAPKVFLPAFTAWPGALTRPALPSKLTRGAAADLALTSELDHRVGADQQGRELLPTGARRLALDVEAGSGHDAVGLAGLDFEVVDTGRSGVAVARRSTEEQPEVDPLMPHQLVTSVACRARAVFLEDALG